MPSYMMRVIRYQLQYQNFIIAIGGHLLAQFPILLDLDLYFERCRHRRFGWGRAVAGLVGASPPPPLVPPWFGAQQTSFSCPMKTVCKSSQQCVLKWGQQQNVRNEILICPSEQWLTFVNWFNYVIYKCWWCFYQDCAFFPSWHFLSDKFFQTRYHERRKINIH